MKATPKFYARPNSAPTCEVVPVVSIGGPDTLFAGGINVRFLAMGEMNGEMHVRMTREEALSLAAEIVLKVARGRV
jgi:hypothetical protein